MNPLLFFFIATQLLIVAFIDFKHKVISNRWHLLNIILAIFLYTSAPEGFQFEWQILVFPMGYILFGFLLFLVGVMGAGDSKYLASICLLIPLQFHFAFFEMLLLSTSCVGGCLLVYRLFKDFRKIQAYLLTRYWQGIKLIIKSEFSYAPVIFLAWILLGLKQWAS